MTSGGLCHSSELHVFIWRLLWFLITVGMSFGSLLHWGCPSSLVGESPSCSPVSSSSSPQKHTRKIQFSIFKSLPPLPYTRVPPLTLFAPLTPSPRPLTLSPRPLYRHPAPTINIVMKDFLQLTRRRSKQEHDVLRKAHVTYEQDRGLETRIKCSQLSKLLNKPRVGTPALNWDLQKPQLPVCLEVMELQRGEGCPPSPLVHTDRGTWRNEEQI